MNGHLEYNDETLVDYDENLLARLSNVAANVRESLGICEKVLQSVTRRFQWHIGALIVIVTPIKSLFFSPKLLICEPILLYQNGFFMYILPLFTVWPMNSGVPCIQSVKFYSGHLKTCKHHKKKDEYFLRIQCFFMDIGESN